MDPNRISNNPAIAEKLFTEIFVNNNLKNVEQNQSKRKGIMLMDMPSGPSMVSGSGGNRMHNSNITQTHFESANMNYVTSSSASSNSYMQQEIRNVDNDVNILIYTNRTENLDRHKKLTFHDVLISELTENHHRANETAKRHYATTKILPNNHNHMNNNSNKNTIISNACTININSDWSDLTTAAATATSHAKTTINVNNNVDSGGHGYQNRISFPGLPPLPQSLSGMEINTVNNTFSQNDRGDKDGRIVNLDNHLAILKREMFGLRQLDLSLLSQLWALNESIQEYRVISQEQENFTMQSSSPSPSETVSLSSTDDSNIVTSPIENTIFNGRNKMGQQQLQSQPTHQPKPMTPRMQTAPPPPPTTTSSSRMPQNRN